MGIGTMQGPPFVVAMMILPKPYLCREYAQIESISKVHKVTVDSPSTLFVLDHWEEGGGREYSRQE